MKIEYHNIYNALCFCNAEEQKKLLNFYQKQSGNQVEWKAVLGYSGCFVVESGKNQVYFDAVALLKLPFSSLLIVHDKKYVIFWK